MLNIIHRTDQGFRSAMLAAFAFLAANAAAAQAPATDNTTTSAPVEWTALSSQALDELVGPIALYPDDLIAIVLPAATYPLQIVQASRYLEDRETDATLEPDPAWDDSVVALLNYPEALALLNDDLDWTWELGEAVVYQQGDVLNAIQSFRDRAQAAGNLSTDDRQVVATEADGAITIAPADPEVIYVPYYDPARVVVHQHVPVYHYYPYAYPVYYYPYPHGYTFGSGFFWGVTTAFLVSWPDHYLHVRHHSHIGHPYYGYAYYTPWYARTNVYVNVNHYGNHHYWRPGYGHGGRPQHHAGYATRYDGSDRRMRTTRITDWRRDTPATYTRNRGLGRVDDDGGRRLRDGRIQGSYPRTGQGSDPRGTTRRVIDDAELRRLRSGRSPENRGNVRANADTPRERSSADAYRRPRVTDGRMTGDVDRRSTRTQDAGRFARIDPSARSSRGEPGRAGLAAQMRTSPSTFARVAPTQRTPAAPRSAAPRPAQSREQPVSWPRARDARPSTGQAERRTPSADAGHAQRGARPMPRDAGAGRGSGNGRLQFSDRGQRRR